MSETLHKLQVVIEGNASKLNQAAREAMATTRRLTASLNAEMRRINSPVENLRKSMNDGRNDFGLGRLRQVMREIRNYGKEAQVAAGIKVYTDDYKELLQKYTDIEKKQDDLLKKIKAMPSSESFVPTKEFEDLEKNIQKSSDALEKLNWKRVKMERSGKDVVPTKKFTDLEKSIQKTSQMLKNLDDQRVKMEQSGKNTVFTEKYNDILKNKEKLEKQLSSLQEQAERTEMTKGHPGEPGSSRSFAFERAEKKLEFLNSEIGKAKNRLETIDNELEMMQERGEATEQSNAYRELTREITEAEKKLQEYKDAKNAMLSDGSYQRETDSYREVTWEISRMNKKLQEYLDLRSALTQDGSALEKSDALIKNEQAFERMNEELQRYEAELGELEKSGKDIKISDKWKNASTGILSKTFSGMKSTLGQVTAGIKTAGGAFASLIQKFATGIPIIGRARNSMNGLGNAGRGLSGILGTLGMTAKFMAASFIIQGSVNGAKQGLENLAQYSDRTNASMSTLKTSLVQLQNGLATAFEPILTAVTPILDTLINYLISATNAIAQFFAALTGQSTYTKATRAQQDYAAGLNKTSSAANGANNSVKALQRTVLGFDEINKLEDKSSSGGSGGSGGAGVSGMFDTETVANSYADFAEKIKDAWAKADFTELGGIFGTKIRDALNNIPWDDIKETAQKVGKSLATFINGAVEVSGLSDAVGNTVAELLNTGVAGANSFMEDLHWDSVGQFVADSMNSFVQKANWKGIGTAVKNGVNGVMEAKATWVDAFNFKEAGEAIKTAANTALSGIDWSTAITAASNFGSGVAEFMCTLMTKETFENVGITAAGALNTVFGGLSSLLDGTNFKQLGIDLAVGINKAIEETDFETIGNAIGGLIQGAMDFAGGILDGLSWEGIKNALQDLFKGIAEKVDLAEAGKVLAAAFGAWLSVNIVTSIGSTVLASIGSALISGLVSAAAAAVAAVGLGPIALAIGVALAAIFVIPKVVEWLKDVDWEGIGNKISTLFAEKIGDIGATVKAGVELVKLRWKNLTSWLSSLGEDIKSVVDVGVLLVKLRWKNLTSWLSSLGNDIKGGIDVGVRLIKSNWSTLMDWLGFAAKTVVELAVTVKETAASKLAAIKENWEVIKTKAVTLTAGAREAAGSVLSNIRTTWGVIQTKFVTLTADAKEKTSNALSGIQSVWQVITSKFATLTAEGKEGSSFKDTTKVWDGIKDKTAKLTFEVMDNVSEWWHSVTEWWDNLFGEGDKKEEFSGSGKKITIDADLKVDKVEIPEDKKKVADLTGIITNKTIQWKNPIDSKIPGLEGQVSKVTPALGWDSSLDGVRAEILSMSPAKGWNDTLANVTAQAKKIVFAKNVNNGLDGVKAVFTSKKISFDKTVGSMTAQFEKKTVKNFNRTIGNMNAQFEKKSTKDFNRTIGNMTAQFDKGKDNIKDKTYGGFWARMDRASDNVSNGDKYLSGVTAEVNRLTKVAGTVLELAGTIVAGGGGVKIKLASGGLYKNGQWQPVTAAASGGAFSTGQMFIAREAGPELVGRIGRSTAVMNNNQIVSSVASGVYSAVSAAMSQFSSRGSGSDTPVFNIYVGGKKITDVVIEEVNRRTSATGSCPILT